MEASPLRERLIVFWVIITLTRPLFCADHYTATPKAGIFRRAATSYVAIHYVESALHLHITGQFEDLLLTAVLHPLVSANLIRTALSGQTHSGRPKTGRCPT